MHRNKVLFLLAGLFLLALLFGGLFSVAVQVGSRGGSYETVEEGFVACEQARSAHSGTCDPCGLACPSSARDGSYETWDGRIIEFDPSLCSDRYTPLGNLLEVKSYCHDTITVCTEQVGSATFVDSFSVRNGLVNEYVYPSASVNCATGEQYGSSYDTEYYELVCDQDYYVDGSRTSHTRSGLGSCELVDTREEVEASKSASIINVQSAQQAVSGSVITVTGTAKLETAGTYYFALTESKSSAQAFSVITGKSARNVCGSQADYDVAARVTGEAGDDVVFQLLFSTPSVSQDKEVRDLFVQVTGGCGSAALDTATISYELFADKTSLDQEYSQVIGDERFGAIESGIDSVIGTSCFEGETAEIDGCVVAECVDEVYQPLSEYLCDDGTSYKSTQPSTQQGVQQARITFFETIWNWIKSLFSGWFA